MEFNDRTEYLLKKLLEYHYKCGPEYRDLEPEWDEINELRKELGW